MIKLLSWVTGKLGGSKLAVILLSLLLVAGGLLVANNIRLNASLVKYEQMVKDEQEKAKALKNSLDLALTEVIGWKAQVDSANESCELRIKSLTDAYNANEKSNKVFDEILGDLDNEKSKATGDGSSNNRPIDSLSIADKQLLDRAYCAAVPQDSFCNKGDKP